MCVFWILKVVMVTGLLGCSFFAPHEGCSARCLAGAAAHGCRAGLEVLGISPSPLSCGRDA